MSKSRIHGWQEGSWISLSVVFSNPTRSRIGTPTGTSATGARSVIRMPLCMTGADPWHPPRAARSAAMAHLFHREVGMVEFLLRLG